MTRLAPLPEALVYRWGVGSHTVTLRFAQPAPGERGKCTLSWSPGLPAEQPTIDERRQYDEGIACATARIADAFGFERLDLEHLGVRGGAASICGPAQRDQSTTQHQPFTRKQHHEFHQGTQAPPVARTAR